MTVILNWENVQTYKDLCVVTNNPDYIETYFVLKKSSEMICAVNPGLWYTVHYTDYTV